ncbi:Spc97/Spc98 family protein [Coccidioides immitis RS]|uniref:Spindle pole body component n=1 Tax=Coccidioides immitis (strain RS) TaxID=246410 RepID=J3KGP6_COCIM|nr:Spc97/Spc98 family protein [Coccidioides immitis RS]EAS34937.3 Spc97/Spc98 family protein [Coccidioides immitis RS]
MLHEILLSLSGQPSPLFDQSTTEGDSATAGFPLLTPPEKALLSSIAHLSRLHKLLRSHTSQISSSHPSTVCRAVSTSIATEHLGNFQRKILDVEKAILTCDPGYVGGYGIVPLSTIVGDFAPWVRRMEWLWDVARFMLPESLRGEEHAPRITPSTGAELIDRLTKDSQTGYVDLEEMALALIKTAETAWMRQLSMWILYGQLPAFGRDDFFIQEVPRSLDGTKAQNVEYIVRPSLLPKFLSEATAASILFIGKSLNHIRARGDFSAGAESKASASHMTLHGDYIRRLSALSSPLSPVTMNNTISDIRLSLSQTVLSRLLPLPKLVEILSVLHGFLLLGRGEFAMALVSFADGQILLKHRRMAPVKPAHTGLQSLDFLGIKDGEVSTVLSQAWAELYSLQNEEDPIDDELDLARDLLRLVVKRKAEDQVSFEKESVTGSSSVAEISDVAFDDLLFGASTVLSLDVQSPLDLFLAQSDMSIYSRIHAYLLGIRRAQIRLSGLWKCTSIRRIHPAPWGPPLSNKPEGQERLRVGRERERRRCTLMRSIWASCSAALFVVSELGSYLQGEVISGSWRHFKQWLDGTKPSWTPGNSRPGTAKSKHLDDSGDSSYPQHDPETITIAHRTYLAYISQSLFLTDVPFTQTLRSFLAHIDDFISLITQLQTIQQNLDLENDEGVFDSLASYSEDEQGVWYKLCQARADLDAGIMELISRLRDIDDGRFAEGIRMFDFRNNDTQSHTTGSDSFAERTNTYVPWRAAGVDRLLMKLDFGTSRTAPGSFGFKDEFID